MINLKKLGLFAGGVLFGTAGIAILSSKDAKDINEVRYEKAAEEKVAAARAIVEEYEQKAEEEA